MSHSSKSDKPNITLSLVKDLISEQFSEWANLVIQPVEASGWDNRTYRLGEDKLVRLPSAKEYEAQVAKEQKWLPLISPNISIEIPHPLAMGQPMKNYPFYWSVYTWLDGRSANLLSLDESALGQLASDLSKFLHELHSIDTACAPLPGLHNFYRGGSLLIYDGEIKSSIIQLKNFIDIDAVLFVWERAISSKWNNSPVWVHGDLSAGNILIKHNKLSAVIDFGCMSIGDPACDLVIAWNFFTEESRRIFKSMMQLDSNTWYRAQGWALWKAMITLNALADKTCSDAKKQKLIIDAILKKM